MARERLPLERWIAPAQDHGALPGEGNVGGALARRRAHALASWLAAAAVSIAACRTPASRIGAKAPPPPSAAGAVPALVRAPCVTEALEAVGATCYTFRGQERWDAPNGRTVTLPVAVIAPSSPAVSDVPVVFFPGGPGYSILDNRGYLDRLRRDIGPRVLVVMDHRGFVHAEPSLRCPAYAAVSPYHNIIHTPAITASGDPMERLATIAPVVQDCYRKLQSEGIAVAQYNSFAVSRDVDEIRRLLGYERIDLFGSSTGSGTALLYIRYFPERARAAVFGWPWYNHLRNRPFVDEFYTAKQTFTDALALCVADSDRCRALVPAWLRAIDRARRALDAEPFVVEVEHDGGTRTLRFDGAAFLDTLYLTLADDYGRLPTLVARITAGDRSMLREFFRIDEYTAEPRAPGYALGYFLAHICNDMGKNRPARADSLAAIEREPAVLGFEPPWLCAWWGTDGAVPPQHNDPVESTIPALAIHGQLDPCCGTRWSERLAKSMPRLQIVELQGVGHSPETSCRSRLIRAFLAAPDEPVDRRCRDEVPLRWELSLDPSRASPPY